MKHPDNDAAVPAPSPAGRKRRLLSLAATLSVAALGLASCSAAPAAPSSTVNTAIDAQTAEFFNNDSIHTITVEADEEELTAALEAYAADSTKQWVKATVSIDGNKFENVGLRLKGNSSLRGTTAEDDPTELPWIIRLDKYVDGQQYPGRAEFVVRGNGSETSLNEALALELVGTAGLATQHAAATSFSINGADARLRLVIDNPDDELWNEETFSGDGVTYEAESDGDYSYRGENGEDYADAFSVKTGDETNLQPVAEFLEFVNKSSDEDFASQLKDQLDVDQFATYLAVQELIGNSDDIDGPGNNSYLRYDETSGKMTVISWDLNMSFGTMNGGGGGGAPGANGQRPQLSDGFRPGQAPEGAVPSGAPQPDGTATRNGSAQAENSNGQNAQSQDKAQDANGERTAPGGGRGGMGGKQNPLVTRFLANEDFKALYEQKLKDLQASLYDSGLADEILQKWSTLLTEQAGSLVEAATVTKESQNIETFIEDGGGSQGFGDQAPDGGTGGKEQDGGTGDADAPASPSA